MAAAPGFGIYDELAVLEDERQLSSSLNMTALPALTPRTDSAAAPAAPAPPDGAPAPPVSGRKAGRRPAAKRAGKSRSPHQLPRTKTLGILEEADRGDYMDVFLDRFGADEVAPPVVTPSKREDAVALMNRLKESEAAVLQRATGGPVDDENMYLHLERVWEDVAKVLSRQVSVGCVERGRVARRLFDRYRVRVAELEATVRRQQAEFAAAELEARTRADEAVAVADKARVQAKLLEHDIEVLNHQLGETRDRLRDEREAAAQREATIKQLRTDLESAKNHSSGTEDEIARFQSSFLKISTNVAQVEDLLGREAVRAVADDDVADPDEGLKTVADEANETLSLMIHFLQTRHERTNSVETQTLNPKEVLAMKWEHIHALELKAVQNNDMAMLARCREMAKALQGEQDNHMTKLQVELEEAIVSHKTQANLLRQRIQELTISGKLKGLTGPPRGLVAMVMTDVQGSTELWETLPEDMREAQALHDDLARQTMKRSNGYEVNTEGDAFHVAFNSAYEAICWCVALQEALVRAPWPKTILGTPAAAQERDAKGQLLLSGLRVRMGCHFGPPSETHEHKVTGRTYYEGAVVDICKSVSDLAHGGQILLTRDFLHEIEYCMDKLSDPEIVHLGTHLLELHSQPMDVYQLTPKTLAGRSFPKLRSKLNISAGAYEAPVGPQIALVFCSIQGLADIKQKVPTAATTATSAVCQVIRTSLRQHNGYECQEIDATFMLAFEQTMDAVKFCLNVQEACGYVSWPSELRVCEASKEVWETQGTGELIFRGLRICMGIVTGRPTEIKPHRTTGRMDYFGPMVNRAARIMGFASGGQIVIDGNSMEEVRPKLEELSETVIYDLGKHTLKGVTSPETLVEVLPKKLAGRAAFFGGTYRQRIRIERNELASSINSLRLRKNKITKDEVANAQEAFVAMVGRFQPQLDHLVTSVSEQERMLMQQLGAILHARGDIGHAYDPQAFVAGVGFSTTAGATGPAETSGEGGASEDPVVDDSGQRERERMARLAVASAERIEQELSLPGWLKGRPNRLRVHQTALSSFSDEIRRLVHSGGNRPLVDRTVTRTFQQIHKQVGALLHYTRFVDARLAYFKELTDELASIRDSLQARVVYRDRGPTREQFAKGVGELRFELSSLLAETYAHRQRVSRTWGTFQNEVSSLSLALPLTKHGGKMIAVFSHDSITSALACVTRYAKAVQEHTEDVEMFLALLAENIGIRRMPKLLTSIDQNDLLVDTPVAQRRLVQPMQLTGISEDEDGGDDDSDDPLGTPIAMSPAGSLSSVAKESPQVEEG